MRDRKNTLYNIYVVKRVLYFIKEEYILSMYAKIYGHLKQRWNVFFFIYMCATTPQAASVYSTLQWKFADT